MESYKIHINIIKHNIYCSKESITKTNQKIAAIHKLVHYLYYIRIFIFGYDGIKISF